MIYDSNLAENLYSFTDPYEVDPSLFIMPDCTRTDILETELDSQGNIFTFDDFIPFNYQAAILCRMFEREWIKRGFVILPRRAGKTELLVIYLLMQAFKKALTTKMPYLRYGIIYPDLNSGKIAAGEKIEQRSRGLPDRKWSENKGILTFSLNGKYRKNIKVTLQIIGLQNMERRRGGGFDGLAGDEFGTLPEGFEPIIMPMISDKVKGKTFLIFFGTPNEVGDFWKRYDEYKIEEDKGDLEYYTYWSDYYNLKHISPEQAKQQLLDYGQELFNIEYGCKRGQVTGAKIFAEQCNRVIREERIREIPWDDSQRKWMVVDIGSSKRDFYAVWILQCNYLNNRWEWIDYTQIPNASEEKVHEWVQGRKHRIGQILMPFDAERGTPTPRSIMQELFPQAEVTVVRKVLKDERIKAAKRLFNHSHFHMQYTAMGWNCLKNYSRKWEKKNGIYLLDPKHDRFSHGADAFCYFAVACQTTGAGGVNKELNYETKQNIGVGVGIPAVGTVYNPMDSFLKKQFGA